MEYLIFIIILFSVVNTITKSAKKAQKTATRRESGPDARPRASGNTGSSVRKSMPMSGRGGFSDMLKSLEDMANKYAGEGRPEHRDPQAYEPETGLSAHESPGFGQGESYVDEHGYVGGSLPHEPDAPRQGMGYADDYGYIGSLAYRTHEGEEFPGHEHRAWPAEAYAHTKEAPAVARTTGRISAGQMRDAVVMAEILSPPVSRRRRRA